MHGSYGKCLSKKNTSINEKNLNRFSLIFTFNVQFSVLLIVIILFEIGIGAFGYANKEELKIALDKGFNKTLHNYEPNREAWDMVQSEV